MIVVSACLAGLKVRYNGSHRLDQRIEELVEEGKAVTVCPELLGGLSTPRPPAEIIGGDGHDVLQGLASVIDVHGTDVTEMYVKGAKMALEQIQSLKATAVVLKEYSPSCGNRMIYRGDFNGGTKAGVGVTSALLKQHGIQVFSEEDDWTSLFL
ncbi:MULTISPECIES: DUF523 domain-containing protein [Bacillus]|uniref:DUF523 domain-containing protein n=1 Tax=Bacillus TaxID=1386 RepID=UPI000771A403|nr:DUF523 domain-containing protein [Bacillus safensis]MBU8606195.1 DUF523 domain-containing protein [Bacillus safensis]MBU8617475.1 DUF523 domain-containing protein [Bacillus safensis]MBU8628603.1 DUF523 domain-containing protein [Bacillus safensis]MCY1097541.1 DUF523 domain-containing protein [Bacillus safensis]MCY7523250.1 DUF523 domain-containing protein [Bacillus safensis]